MLRKKKRQSEREAGSAQTDQDESDMNGAPREEAGHLAQEGNINRRQPEVGESSAGQIDLNCHPDREDMQVDVAGPSMNGHLETQSYQLQEYMNQNGSTGEAQGYLTNGGSIASVVWERERRERRDGEVYDPNSNHNNLH